MNIDNVDDPFEKEKEKNIEEANKIADEILKDIISIFESKYSIDTRPLDEKLEDYKKVISKDRFIWVAAFLKGMEKERLTAYKKLKNAIREICYYQKSFIPDL